MDTISGAQVRSYLFIQFDAIQSHIPLGRSQHIKKTLTPYNRGKQPEAKKHTSTKKRKGEQNGGPSAPQMSSPMTNITKGELSILVQGQGEQSGFYGFSECQQNGSIQISVGISVQRTGAMMEKACFLGSAWWHSSVKET